MARTIRPLAGGGVTTMARTYRMTPTQSEDWTLGADAAAQVEQEILDDLHDDMPGADVDVLLDDGSVAFSVWMTV